jgi:hypothetical protein
MVGQPAIEASAAVNARSRLRRWLLPALFLAQLGAAAAGIVTHERTLNTGTLVHLAVAPVDPSDPFRGRYVQLAFEIEQQQYAALGPISRDQAAYAILRDDLGGAVQVKYVSVHRPPTGLYLRVVAWTTGSNRARIEVPFKRYYMHERLAPRAEAAYRKLVNTSQSYASVRIRDGHAVLEAVYIGGRTIEQAARAPD